MTNQSISRETIVLLKLLDSIKDLLAIAESLIEKPGPSQVEILKRKIKIVKNRLPKMSGEIKTYTRRRETQQLTFENLGDKTVVER